MGRHSQKNTVSQKRIPVGRRRLGGKQKMPKKLLELKGEQKEI